MIGRVFVGFSLVIMMATTAGAYTTTCSIASDALLSGDPQLEGAVIGLAMGTLDVTAALVCLGRLPACSCLQNLFSNDPSGFGGEYGRRLAQCSVSAPNQGAWTPAFDAVKALCPF